MSSASPPEEVSPSQPKLSRNLQANQMVWCPRAQQGVLSKLQSFPVPDALAHWTINTVQSNICQSACHLRAWECHSDGVPMRSSEKGASWMTSGGVRNSWFQYSSEIYKLMVSPLHASISFPVKQIIMPALPFARINCSSRCELKCLLNQGSLGKGRSITVKELFQSWHATLPSTKTLTLNLG